jgi:glutamine synthetase
MTFDPIQDTEDAARRVRADGPDFVKVGLFDIDGVMRGKFMHRDKFLATLEKGFGFCDVVLGWDIDDQLYDNARITGWHTGFPDVRVRIVPETGRRIPFEDGCWLFIAEFADGAAAVCPRNVLRRTLARVEDAGFTARAGFEYEFFLFDETPASVRAKNYHGMTPVTPGNTGYSLLRQSTLSDLYREVFTVSEALGAILEGIHEEMGPGVVEAALAPASGVAVADRAALFRTFAKVVAQRHGAMATFMAKWDAAQAGQSGHLHLSLAPVGGGTNAFHDDDVPDGMTATMRHFIGGLQTWGPELAALFAPTVNSYRRLVPGMWAPTDMSWGIDNRTCAIRVIPGDAESLRIEFRAPGADANPYLAMAATLAAGMEGIARKTAPDDPISGDAYAAPQPPERHLPRTLEDAAARFAQSEVALRWFGDAFVEHFAATRDWEVRQFRKHVTDWELARYFELI